MKSAFKSVRDRTRFVIPLLQVFKLSLVVAVVWIEQTIEKSKFPVLPLHYTAISNFTHYTTKFLKVNSFQNFVKPFLNMLLNYNP